jgi:hypothetical protein
VRRVSARATNRRHRWRLYVVSALALCGALGSAQPAMAAVSIGQLAPDPPAANCTTPGLDYLQPSVTGGNLYVAKEAGTITTWSTNSSGAGATYVLKIFRRTSDPDSFQVMSHSAPHLLSLGVNNFPVSIPVKSGDMIGFHESGPPNSCTFTSIGDSVLDRTGNLQDGSAGTFAPLNDVRLNLSAVLAPDNSFTFSGIARDRKRGTATITVTTSNPGLVTAAGKGMKKRAPKNIAVAGPVSFPVVATGKARHRLARTGKVVLPVRVTFFPPGGDPAVQSINLRLKRIRPSRPI